MHKFSLFLALLIAMAFAGCADSGCTVISDVLSAEITRTQDQSPNYRPKLAVFIDSTDRHDSWITMGKSTTEDLAADIQKGLPSASREVIDDYIANNRQPSRLNHCIKLPLRVVYISRERADEFLKAEPFMKGFYDAYPESTGITRVSQVGFDRTRTQALVYLDHWSGDLSGGGALVLAEKVKGKWVVKEMAYNWRS